MWPHHAFADTTTPPHPHLGDLGVCVFRSCLCAASPGWYNFSFLACLECPAESGKEGMKEEGKKRWWKMKKRAGANECHDKWRVGFPDCVQHTLSGGRGPQRGGCVKCSNCWSGIPNWANSVSGITACVLTPLENKQVSARFNKCQVYLGTGKYKCGTVLIIQYLACAYAFVSECTCVCVSPDCCFHSTLVT